MALKIALDTICYRDFCAGDREVLDRVQLAERVVLPFVTLAELRAGFRCGTRAAENERVLQRFLHRPRVAAILGEWVRIDMLTRFRRGQTRACPVSHCS